MQERTLGVATPCEKDDNHCGHSEHLRCMWRILGRTVLCYPLPLYVLLSFLCEREYRVPGLSITV